MCSRKITSHLSDKLEQKPEDKVAHNVLQNFAFLVPVQVLFSPRIAAIFKVKGKRIPGALSEREICQFHSHVNY